MLVILGNISTSCVKLRFRKICHNFAMKQRTSKGGTSAVANLPMTGPRAYEENALKELRNAGFRITMPRVQVIRALADTDIALSAYAIHDKIINSNGKIDVVSVYRILSTLQEVGLIHHIGVVDGYYPCLLENGAEKRSEVLVDEDTGVVLEIPMPKSLIETIEAQVKAAGFATTSIKVEITGKELSAK
jgi:Fur family transcriptional regulator, zinc uptake regulator